MSKNLTKFESECLLDERDFLMEELRNCDYCTTDFEAHARCWSETARESGARSRACLQ